MRLRRARHAVELLALAEPLEPRTTRLVGELSRRELGRWCKGWLAEDDTAACVGAVLITRVCLDRWSALPMVLDEAAAPALAALIDHSAAWEVVGAAPDVAPLLPHLRRGGRTVIEMPLVGASTPVDPLEPVDPRTRPATIDDLDDLVRLYASYELDLVPTRRRLRRFLAEALAHRPLVVAEAGGQIVGAARCDGQSRRFAFWSGLTVLPEHRGERLSWAIAMRAMEVSAAAGLAVQAAIFPSNPWRVADKAAGREEYSEHAWLEVPLRPPQRFRGHGRLRRLAERMEGPLARRPLPF